MKQNINIEAEGNELILKNKVGDYVIIPKKYRLEVQDMIKENCHSCIDKLVETLPVMEDYAEDGSLISRFLFPSMYEIVDKMKEIKNKDVKTPENIAYLEQLHKSIPTTYPNIFNAYTVYQDIAKGRTSKTHEKYKELGEYDYQVSDALRRKWIGLDYDSNILKESKYSPSKSTNPNTKYYTFNLKEYPDMDELIERAKILQENKQDTWKDLLPFRDIDPEKETAQAFYMDDISKKLGLVDLRNYKVGLGEDERGKYVSFYDLWDIDIPYTGIDFNEITNPFEIYDRIYYKDYGNKQNKKMYYSDKELSELDVNKKNFDTLALQRELSNRGYKLPKSTKKDGTFDGIWGDETKNALLEYLEN